MQRSYDSLGRVVSQQAPYQGNTVGATTYSYDVLNRITQMQHPISQGSGTLATTTYQYAGRTTTVTDPNGNTRTLVDDVNGWLRHTKDGAGYAVITGYDAAGSQRSVTDSQGNILWSGNWAYGTAPFLTGETSLDRGSWGYTVDALGERIAWTDAKLQSFSATYDALSRPLTRSEPDLFTQWTWGSTPAAHNIGKLQAVCTGTGSNPTGCTTSGESESWSYDSLGRLYQRATSLPSANPYTYTWQYNSTTGFLNSLTYPVGSSGKALTLQYGYAYGYLQSITDTLDSPNIVVWQANKMNPAGQITTDTLGNGVVTTRTFDAVTHLVDSIQSGVGVGTALQNNAYLFDADGNLAQRQDNNLGLTENFYYDADNRLSYSTLNGTQNLHLSYDAMGNITSRTDVANNASWTYDPTHKHQVTEAGSAAYQYGYDANGNQKTWLGNLVTWTAANYPSGINDAATGESVTFEYGPDRKPWLETTYEPTGTTQSYHVGSLMSIVVAGGGSTDRDYIYAGNEPVAVDVPGSGPSGLHYFLTDHQESISAITNGSGQVAVNESFTAFGARRNPSTWSGAPTGAQLTTAAGITQYGYTWQRALGQQTNLNDMVGRVEDATTGRFMSADPTAPNPTDPQNWNPYSYTGNNPLTFIDPSGFCTSGFGNGDDLTVTICATPLPAFGAGGGSSGGGGSADPTNSNLGSRLNNKINNKPQSNQGCQNNGLFARAGRDLVSAGQWLSNVGNKTAAAGADVAVVSAVASAVGIPAEPGIVLGGGVAAVGDGESLIGSGFQYLGGIMSQNPSAAGQGFFGMTLGWAEGVAFGPLAQFGLPGLPSGIPDPVDAVSAAAASGSGGGSCP